MKHASTALELSAFAAFTYAAWLVNVALGVLVAGLCLLVLSLAADGVTLPRRPERSPGYPPATTVTSLQSPE